MYTEINYNNSLYHHGTKGQKWGIRRYQNEDGSLTAAGRARYAKSEYKKAKDSFNKEFNNAYKFQNKYPIRTTFKKKEKAINENNWYRVDSKAEDLDKAKKKYKEAKKQSNAELKENAINSIKNIDKEKAAKILAATAAVAVTAYVVSNPDRRKAVAEFTKKTATETAKNVAERTKKGAGAMYDAALASVGVIAVNKLANKLDPGPNATETQKDISKVAYDTAKAGIEEATRSNRTTNNSYKNQNGKSIGKEVTDKIGKPENKERAKYTTEWPTLMNELRNDPNMKATAKSLADAGYSIDQIKAYVYGGIQHSATNGYHALIKFI